ncbi:hypothetical protein D3C84_782690 [compost metagenome]
MHRGAIGHAKGGGVGEVHLLRDRQHVIARHCHLLGKAAPAGQGHDPVADLEISDFLAHRADDPRRLATGREGQGRLELVLALDDQGVGKVDPGRMYIQEDFVLLRYGACDLFQDQTLSRAQGFAQHCFHRDYSFARSGR